MTGFSPEGGVINANAYGGSSLDGIMPQVPLDQAPEGYNAGGKSDIWTAERQVEFDTHVAEARTGRSDVEFHIGGNAVNAAAYLASKGHNVRVTTVVGVGDVASEAIRAHLPHMGIGGSVITKPGYTPSVGLIERVGNDRMVIGRPRSTVLGEHITDDHIRDGLVGADSVLMASLKDPELAERVLSMAPPDLFVSWNPGGAEFTKYPVELQRLMRGRSVNLLAVNDEEIGQLYGYQNVDKDTAVKLAERASGELAEHVVVTLGSAGLALANNGDSIRQGIVRVDNVVDTLGAGDRVHGVMFEGLRLGHDGATVLERAAHSAAQLIQHTGAHADLPGYQRAVLL